MTDEPMDRPWRPGDSDEHLAQRLAAVLRAQPRNARLSWWAPSIDLDTWVTQRYVDVEVPALGRAIGTHHLWWVDAPLPPTTTIGGPLGLVAGRCLEDPDVLAVEDISAAITLWVRRHAGRRDIRVTPDPSILDPGIPPRPGVLAQALRDQYARRDQLLDLLDGSRTFSVRWVTHPSPTPEVRGPCVPIYVPDLASELGEKPAWLAFDQGRCPVVPREPLAVGVQRSLGSPQGITTVDISETLEAWISTRIGRDICVWHDPGQRADHAAARRVEGRAVASDSSSPSRSTASAPVASRGARLH